MRVQPPAVLLAACLAFLACSHAPPGGTPAPQPGAAPAAGAAAAPAPAGIAGDWSLTLLIAGARTTSGALRLRQSADGGYNGFLQMEGTSQAFAVRSARVEGAHFVIVVDTDDGEGRIEGNLRGQTRFDALYTTLHTSGRMSGTKQ